MWPLRTAYMPPTRTFGRCQRRNETVMLPAITLSRSSRLNSIALLSNRHGIPRETREAASTRKPRPTDRPGLPALHFPYGNGIVLNTPHGVAAPAPLMLLVPVTPGM
jgi:hypothetical protein